MKRICTIFWLGALMLCTAPAHGQAEQSDEEACPVGQLDMSAASAASASSASASVDAASREAKRLRAAEQRVQSRIAHDGLHVVHFWAPWRSNSRSELENGWAKLVRHNPEVSFTFVTVWNEGASGAPLLNDYNLPNRVLELTAPGGSQSQEAGRVHFFLDLPVTWIPTTWIFHNNGDLAFAMNYGEMQMDTVQHLIDVTRQDW